jgi:NTE family protein
MKIGLCLPGGGAKGAFQGGVIKRLYENKIIPSIITGTSIGAINSYFIMKDSHKELEDFWMNMEERKYQGKIDKTIDNSKFMKVLSELKGNNSKIKNVYVNYVNIENCNLSEKILDIKNINEKEAIDAVKYSSLLPIRVEKGEDPEATASKFDSKKVFQYFKEDVSIGVYNGYKLDGGILNNNLLSPFIDNKVDMIIIAGLKQDYTVPEYIYNFYKSSDLVVIRPDVPSNPWDTVRFEQDYCKDMYTRGYRIARESIDTFFNNFHRG